MRSFKKLGIKKINGSYSSGIQSGGKSKEIISSYSPVDGAEIAVVKMTTRQEYESILFKAKAAQKEWRKKPAPVRGEIVRQMGQAFRLHKQALGELVSYEMGKSLQEGLGEVQEIIDICDFAVGLSRQLYGLSMHS